MARLRALYAKHAYRPLWTDEDGGRRVAAQLLEVLGQSEQDGLDPRDYASAAISKRAGAGSAMELGELELLLTHEILRYAEDLRNGRMKTRNADPELFVHHGELDRADLIAAATASGDLRGVLAGFAPGNPVYRHLRRLLAKLRGIADLGGWPVVPKGRPLAEGMSDRRVKALRRRLWLSGDLADPGPPTTAFDAELSQAVQVFQRRHGLEPDGVVAGATRRALNISVKKRIQQVIVNMERWRWMPDHLGRRHILVNIAAFELEVVEDGWPVLTMRVVTGRPYRRTPWFSGRMTYLEFNPTWTVPNSIAEGDYLPRLRRDPAILRDQNIRVFDDWRPGARELDPREIDWHGVRPGRFPYVLRQDPGPENALGRIKFMFPNPFKVYLHDTPRDELFSRKVRTFSSGCIRVADPLELAAVLFKDDPAWTLEAIDEAIRSGGTTRADLAEPVPVHVTYSTVWAGSDGTIHFRDDVYGRDDLLGRALFGRVTRAPIN